MKATSEILGIVTEGEADLVIDDQFYHVEPKKSWCIPEGMEYQWKITKAPFRSVITKPKM